MRASWSRVKSGIIPLIVIGVFYFIFHELRRAINAIGFHPTGWPIIDIFLAIVIVLIAAELIGRIFEWEWVGNLVKHHLYKIPYIGSILLILVAKHNNLRVVEIRTTVGPTPDEGCWEFGIATAGPWVRKGILCHTVHTIGVGSRLISCVTQSNIRDPKKSFREVSIAALSGGTLFSPPPPEEDDEEGKS
jgi:hypothetical protein